jgi:uncharacterized protein (DUF1810 family)
MYDLDRFVAAQEPVIQTVLREIRAGRKETHWMWFVFPQLRGLGRSTMAYHYGIEDLGEARAFLQHAVLGPRLKDCVEEVLAVPGRTLHDIFGSPDDIKFCSSMTLFALAEQDQRLFQCALEQYCNGQKDLATLRILEARAERNSR